MILNSDRRLIRVLYVISVGIVGFAIACLTQERLYWQAGIVALIGIVLALLDTFSIPKPRKLLKDEFTLNDWVVNKIISKDTVNLIHGRLQRLYGELDYPDAQKVHITVHLAIRSFNDQGIHSDWVLLQLTDYVGARPRGKNRIVSAHKGIIGRTYRVQKPQTTNFNSEADYFAQMTEHFGFFRSEANYHSTEARSYFSMPFGLEADERSFGVFYAFSSVFGAFDANPNNVVNHNYTNACTEIANILSKDALVTAARSR